MAKLTFLANSLCEGLETALKQSPTLISKWGLRFVINSKLGVATLIRLIPKH
jgi:hypothetical protein